MFNALLLSEVGWAGLKKYAGDLLKQGHSPFIVIKGTLSSELRHLLNQNPQIPVKPLNPLFFKIYVFLFIIFSFLFQRQLLVVVTKQKTFKWLQHFRKIFSFKLELIQETSEEGLFNNTIEK